MSEPDNFDIQECARWNAYCSLKEALNQEAFMKYYGSGTFEEFNKKIDGMNLGVALVEGVAFKL